MLPSSPARLGGTDEVVKAGVEEGTIELEHPGAGIRGNDEATRLLLEVHRDTARLAGRSHDRVSETEGVVELEEEALRLREPARSFIAILFGPCELARVERTSRAVTSCSVRKAARNGRGRLTRRRGPSPLRTVALLLPARTTHTGDRLLEGDDVPHADRMPLTGPRVVDAEPSCVAHKACLGPV